MINLEDFSSFLNLEEGKKEKGLEEDLEKIKATYRNKILKLQADFQIKIEKAKEEAYKQGIEEGFKKAKEELEKEFKKSLEENRKRYEEELKTLKTNIDSLIRQIQERGNNLAVKFLQSISDSLVEILEFLYISPENAAYVKESLKDLLSSFNTEELISIEAGENLVKILEGKNVKINKDLGENDFRLIFRDFSLESRLKEKLNLLREELEREIKKLT